MKKLLFVMMLVLGLSAASVHAKVGDIKGKIYSTDILTEVDGLPVKSYAIDGRTLIALEDLKDYGFNVYYNDNIRTVFVTKAGQVAADFKPTVSRGTVGKVDGYYYETDIKAVVNGVEVPAYAIDGKMAAEVEVLGRSDVNEYRRHTYQMLYRYNDSERLLSLDTSLSMYGWNATDVRDMLLGSQQVALNYSLWGPTEARVVHAGDKVSVYKKYGGAPHGGYVLTSYANLDNGLIISPYQIARMYDIYMADEVFSEDGTRLYFKNNDAEGNFRDYKQLELNSMHVYPASENEYTVASEIFKASEYKLRFSIGTEHPTFQLHLIGSADYVKFSDLCSVGYAGAPDGVKLIDGVEYVPLSSVGIYADNSRNDRCFFHYNYDPYQKLVHAFLYEE